MSKLSIKQEMEKRVREVQELLLIATSRREIHRAIFDKYHLSGKEIDYLIKRANKSLDKVIEAQAMASLEHVTLKFNAIYEQAMAAGDFAEANKAIANLAKFSGLEPAKKIESTTKDLTKEEVLKEKPTSELIKLVNSLEEGSER